MDEEFDALGAYELPDPESHPATIAARVLQYPEHEHLREGEARIEWLLRCDAEVKAGRQVLGKACMPRVQGELSGVFRWMLARLFGGLPDFLIILDKGYWDGASEREREILVFHELSHCVQKVNKYGEPRFDPETGRPVWGLAGHDVEEFTSVVRRYGAWNQDIRDFIAAANSRG